ncbi:MAG: hypothetical protein QM831_03480 [Kofleriaceae bacterium]
MLSRLFLMAMLVAGCTDDDAPEVVRERVGRDLPPVLAKAKLPFGLAVPDPDFATGWLNDHVFTDKNYQGGGVYRVPPEAVCAGVTDCTARVEPLALRVRVDGEDFHVQVDDQHDEPLLITLGSDMDARLALDDRSLNAFSAALGVAMPTLPAHGMIEAKVATDATWLEMDVTASIDLVLPAVEQSPFAVTMLSLDGSVTGDTAQLQVTDGSLTFVTEPAQYGVSVDAGQCVTFPGSYVVGGC